MSPSEATAPAAMALQAAALPWAPRSPAQTLTHQRPPIGPGTYTETATFFGDANYSASYSAQQNNFTINPASSSMALASGVNPSTYLQPITLTATIDGENGNVRGRANKGRKPVIVSGSVTWSANTGCGTTPVTAGYPRHRDLYDLSAGGAYIQSPRATLVTVTVWRQFCHPERRPGRQ